MTQQIEEERKQRQALEIAYSEARVASRAKNRFISQMSHDIRTPLNAITSMTMVAATHQRDREMLVRSLNSIMMSSEPLLSLVNSVLDFSHIESGLFQSESREAQIPQVFEKMAEMVAGLLQEHQHHMTIDFSGVSRQKVVGVINRWNQIHMLGGEIQVASEKGKGTCFTIHFTLDKVK